MKDVSIILPSIRPQNLEKFYNSAERGCKNHSFEVIIVSPYLIPESLLKKENVHFVHSYANPTIASQMATQICDAEYLYNTTDDGIIQDGAIDLAIDTIRANRVTDIINMKYKEGVLDPVSLEPNGKSSYHPEEYWNAWFHGDLRLPGIDPQWKISLHYFMNLGYYYYLGGYDCKFEYSNHAIHDLMFRAQANGSEIINLERDAFLCSHLPEKNGDHGPVHEAQTGPDKIYFEKLYSQPNITQQRITIAYANWQGKPRIWERRFDANNLPIHP